LLVYDNLTIILCCSFENSRSTDAKQWCYHDNQHAKYGRQWCRSALTDGWR